MSQTRTNPITGNTLKYGEDHIEGLFYQVVSPEGDVLESDSQDHNHKLTIKLIAEFVKKYGFNIDFEVREETVEYD